jgi:hypothetical protein
MAWKLSKTLAKQIDDVRAALDTEVQDMRSEFDDKTERWQDGDKGVEVSAWLDELSEVVDTLDGLELEAPV